MQVRDRRSLRHFSRLPDHDPQPVAPPTATHLKLRRVPAPESGVLAKRERRHVTQAREINGRDHRRGRAGAGRCRALES
jgi:hypothetical protein